MDRKGEREPGAQVAAVGTDTVDPDLATVGLDEGSADGEAKSTRPAIGAALERAEHSLDVGTVEARAVVGDRYLDEVAPSVG